MPGYLRRKMVLADINLSASKWLDHYQTSLFTCLVELVCCCRQLDQCEGHQCNVVRTGARGFGLLQRVQRGRPCAALHLPRHPERHLERQPHIRFGNRHHSPSLSGGESCFRETQPSSIMIKLEKHRQCACIQGWSQAGCFTKSYGLHVQADAMLQASTGFDFAPDAGAHGYRIGVDHTTGVTVYVSRASSAMTLP